MMKQGIGWSLFAAAGLLAHGLMAAEVAGEKETLQPEREQRRGLFSRKAAAQEKFYPFMGDIERLRPALDKILPPYAQIEKLASGFEWSEGPVWVKKGGYLLFSDVPNNVVFKWEPGLGTREHIFPSGYTGTRPRGCELGSNGLALDRKGNLVLCQHGDRRIARQGTDGGFENIARYYKFRRFNSPNDLAYKRNGDLYFTDPPYGLPKLNADPAKELNFNGVYKVSPKGEVTLLTADLTFPNGIAFSPDERILYVAVSDPKNPVIMAYQVQKDGGIANGWVFFDARDLMAGRKGLPDGLKVDEQGNLWATGPGGVLVISPEGDHLGTINTGEATANCAFGGPDGKTLYITADMYLCRVQTLVKGADL